MEKAFPYDKNHQGSHNWSHNATLHIEIITEQQNAERVLLEDLFTLDQLL
ncbi:hypothetical protein AA0115_g12400 [Alternaria tenuissima]|uniref:Uncharacterized protein n=1 Tax=Alternaria tenuissima TaxID=119927 RepID=A0AB37VY79_9PLEO|nr:hypothetical protein AA0115_g12400 [Alternaria tenuissima]